MYAQATDTTIWKLIFWDFFSNHENTRNSAGPEGFIVQQSKLLAKPCLVPAP